MGSCTNIPFYDKIFYYKIMSMSSRNTTVSHSSTPCDNLGEAFKLKLQIITPILFITLPPPSIRTYLGQTLYCMSNIFPDKQ